MQLSATVCSINSICLTQPCETRKEADILREPRKQSGVGRAGILPCSFARSADSAVRRGRTSPRTHRLKQGCDDAFVFTQSHILPPADSMICCAALLIPWGAGAFLPDPFPTTSQGFLPMLSPLIQSELPSFPDNFFENTSYLNILLTPCCVRIQHKHFNHFGCRSHTAF